VLVALVVLVEVAITEYLELHQQFQLLHLH
jgi:hypothetical protein